MRRPTRRIPFPWRWSQERYTRPRAREVRWGYSRSTALCTAMRPTRRVPGLAQAIGFRRGPKFKSDIPKAESVPAGMDNADQPPRLTRNPSKETPAAPPAQPASNAPPSTAPASSGDEPPRLTKSTPPPSDPQKESTQSGQVQPDATKPKTTGDSKAADNKAADQPEGPESDSGATDSNRPTLRRGKPVGPLPDDDVPGYSKPGAVASASGAPAVNGNPAPGTPVDKSSVQLIPAISDAAAPEPKSFTFESLKDEEGERRQQMVTLAMEQVRAYVAGRAKASAIPKPKSAGSTAAARRTAAPKTKDPILENVHMTAYDLWANNQPVMVLSADAHMPPPPAGAPHSEVDSDLQSSIVLVAYPDIYNNLHKIFAGVTDKYHLDMTPTSNWWTRWMSMATGGVSCSSAKFRMGRAGGSFIVLRPTSCGRCMTACIRSRGRLPEHNRSNTSLFRSFR